MLLIWEILGDGDETPDEQDDCGKKMQNVEIGYNVGREVTVIGRTRKRCFLLLIKKTLCIIQIQIYLVNSSRQYGVLRFPEGVALLKGKGS